MKIKAGERVSYAIEPQIESYDAVVVAVNNEGITLQPSRESKPNISKGQLLLISAGNFCATAKLIEVKNDAMKLEWVERRGYFRINDMMPITYKKLREGSVPTRARLFSGYGVEETGYEDVPDETISPKLWKLLGDINSKLSSILDVLHLKKEGLLDTGNQYINISASGIKVIINDEVEAGDMLELKLLLPTCPQTGIIVSGKVVRTRPIDEGKHEVSLAFCGITDEVTNAIMQYTIIRQRELMRKSENNSG